jgi:uncharacterized protein YwgA
MEAESLVANLLNALPKKEIRGKKRLQKLAYFAINSGASANASFFLKDFGPFSPQVANAASYLALVGDVEESDAPVGPAQKFLKVYRLTGPVRDELSEEVKSVVRALDAYTTIELEIASTILYYLSKGLPVDEAIKATKNLKPTKSDDRIIRRARNALSEIGLHEGGRADQVPNP